MQGSDLKNIVRTNGLFLALASPIVITFIVGQIILFFSIPALVENNALGTPSSLRNIFMAFLLFMFVVALAAMAWRFKRRFLEQVNDVTRLSDSISEGDLDTAHDTSSDDEIGALRKSLKMMKVKLAVVISSIRSGAHSVAEAAEQVSQGNSNLSQRTQEQASSLEEIASTMEEMTETVSRNAEHAANASGLVSKVNDSAKQSLVIVSSTIGAMSAIENASKQIGDIITVIEKIAFQTNLLALNAAVEAARAGEQGRGFAVVASEVRELAGRSADAAKEIKELVDDSVSKVDAGSDLIEQTGEALSDISSSLENVNVIASEIAAASQEQSEGINQVNKAISQMDEMTQSNASLVEQAAAASEAMGAQAEELTSLVSYFRLNESIYGNDETQTIDSGELLKAEQEETRKSAGKYQPDDDEDEWKDF